MKIAIFLSGGVDSAAAAYKLLQTGHEVVGITMHVFDHQSAELEDAAYVARRLDIAHHIFDLRIPFNQYVIEPFIQQYEAGLTPNPCLLCNRHIKFGALMAACEPLEIDAFATGHYVRRTTDPATGMVQLFRAQNARKDQSYNLYHLTQETLRKLYFPLGDASDKDAVRASVSEKLPLLSKKRDSLGICFIAPEIKRHTAFLTGRGSSAMQPGSFLTQDGRTIGHHNGIAGFTIGQKRGLPLEAKGYTVIGFRPKSHAVILGYESDLTFNTLQVPDFHCIDPLQIQALKHVALPVTVRTSQWSAPYPATLSLDETNQATIRFESDTRAPAPGQALVCYKGNQLLGGGQIV